MSEKIQIRVGVRIELYKEEFTRNIVQAVKGGIDDAIVNIYMPKLKENTELDDHTLAELAKLGHPYAVRYNPSVAGPQQVHGGDDRLVHKQSGDLSNSWVIRSAVDDLDSIHGHVSSTSEHVDYLIFGTSKMRPRRFHEKTVEDVTERVFVPIIVRLRRLGVRVAGRPFGGVITSVAQAAVPAEASYPPNEE